MTTLYADVLGRTAGAREVAAWTGVLRSGGSRWGVSMGFLLSTEHLSTVVDGYCQHLLGRGLDPNGQRTWVGILQVSPASGPVLYSMFAWGSNGFGQLGDGSRTDRVAPLQLGADTHWASVAAGNQHTAALKTDGNFFVSNDRTGTLTIEGSTLQRNPSGAFETQPGIFFLGGASAPATPGSTVG